MRATPHWVAASRSFTDACQHWDQIMPPDAMDRSPGSIVRRRRPFVAMSRPANGSWLERRKNLRRKHLCATTSFGSVPCGAASGICLCRWAASIRRWLWFKLQPADEMIDMATEKSAQSDAIRTHATVGTEATGLITLCAHFTKEVRQ